MCVRLAGDSREHAPIPARRHDSAGARLLECCMHRYTDTLVAKAAYTSSVRPHTLVAKASYTSRLTPHTLVAKASYTSSLRP